MKRHWLSFVLSGTVGAGGALAFVGFQAPRPVVADTCITPRITNTDTWTTICVTQPNRYTDSCGNTVWIRPNSKEAGGLSGTTYVGGAEFDWMEQRWSPTTCDYSFV